VYNAPLVSGITTHVLDTALGRPAAGVPVVLERDLGSSQWQRVGQGETDGEGRLRTLTSGTTALTPGTYRLVFDTRRYFESRGNASFFPAVTIAFDVASADEHYHVPLLLSPFGYSTYRGS
jgi:5-hydroxyisourate hydrolase